MSNQCSDTGKIMQTVSVEFCPREGCDGIVAKDGVCLKCGRAVYREGDLEKFFGCAPGLTGGLTAREYIERNRSG